MLAAATGDRFNYYFEGLRPFQGQYPKLDSSAMEVIIMAYGVILLLYLVFSLVSYVLYSVGLCSIAKKRGVSHSWLAWLPIGRNWVVGKISDRYQITSRYHYTTNASRLVCVEVLAYVLQVPMALAFQETITYVAGLLRWSGRRVTQQQYELHILPLEEQYHNAMFYLNGVCALVTLAAVLYVILYYKSHYDLFASCRPGQKVVFLVLSILFPVTLPFFVFACRKHDLGMQEQPPERESALPWNTDKIFVDT